MKTLFLSLLFASAALAQLSPITVPNAARLTTTTPVPGRPVLVEGGLVQGDGRGTGGWYIVTNISGTNTFVPAWIAQTGGLLTGASSLAQLQDTNWFPIARRFGHVGMMGIVTNTGAQYILGGDLVSWYNTGSVSSMAQLRLIEPGVGGTVTVDSYYGDGNGGGFTATLTNSIAGTNLYGGMVLAYGGTNSWLNQNPVLNVREFGAKGDTVYENNLVSSGTDDTVYIQAAIDYAIMRGEGGGAVYLPDFGYGYQATTNILVRRRDDVFAAYGLPNPGPAIWNDRIRLKIYGDGPGSTIVTTNVITILDIKGKTNFDSYNNRIQHVIVEDINIQHTSNEVGKTAISIYNAGVITFNRVRSRGGFIGLKLNSLSECQFNKLEFFSQDFGVWTEWPEGQLTSDMAGVTFLDCDLFSQVRACLAAHWYREMFILGGFWGTRSTSAIGSFWFSGLSPVACDTWWLQNVGSESEPTSSVPMVMVGSNGTEGVYTNNIWPLNTYTNSNVSMRGPYIQNCNMSYGTTNGVIRIRGAQPLVRGVDVSGTRFDNASSPHLITIEPEVPSDSKLILGNNNFPRDIIARVLDLRTNLITTIVDDNAGNLLNIGWRDLSRGQTMWSGVVAPVTSDDSLAGPFGLKLAGGTEKVTRVPLMVGATPIILNSNTPIVIDYAVKWPTTNISPQLAVRFFDSTAGLYYDIPSYGIINNHANYTNSYGVWNRYVGKFTPPANANINFLTFNNFGDTNTTVYLGYLALYSDLVSGDASSFVPGNASVWAGRFEEGHTQWTYPIVTGNVFSRKWSSGWAVRGPFSGATTYSDGNCVSSSGNIYLATTNIASGGAAPTHSSGIVNGWAYKATASAATFQIIEHRSSFEGGVTSLAATTALSLISPYDRQVLRTYGYSSGADGGGAEFVWIASYSGPTNSFGNPVRSDGVPYAPAAYAFTGGAWVQIDGGFVNNRQFNITTGGVTNSTAFPTRLLGQVFIGATGSPDASAIVDATSTTQGLLPPRMTKAQRDAIATPGNGLHVYQTDAGNYGPRWYSTTLPGWIKADGTPDP